MRDKQFMGKSKIVSIEGKNIVVTKHYRVVIIKGNDIYLGLFNSWSIVPRRS